MSSRPLKARLDEEAGGSLMFEQENGDRTVLVNEMETALTRLESTLVEASRAITTIRSCIPQISALIEVVNTMESAMTFARQRLGAGPTAETTPLRAMPQQPAVQPSPEPEPVAAESTTPSQYCLRLRVGSKVGSLDLKAVDNAVNEQPAVNDVALIDYDGRQATLRVWVTAMEGPESVRNTLYQSLRSRLGDEDVADIDIEFEERAAA
jgi:hypothetical protein